MPKLRHALCILVVAAATQAGCAPQAADQAASSGPDAGMSLGYVRDLPPADFRDYLLGRPDAFVLDVRQPGEWDDELGHLPGAVLIPAQELESRLAELPADKGRPVAVYDRIGVSGTAAAHLIVRHGWREVVSLMGGLAAYRREGL